MSNECGFTCRACGQFRPGPEGAHSESECLRVQLAAKDAEIAALKAEPMVPLRLVEEIQAAFDSIEDYNEGDPAWSVAVEAAIRAAREGAR